MPDRSNGIAYCPLELLPLSCLAEPSRPPRRRLGGGSGGDISVLPDLTQVTEATRRALYDLVVRDHFSPTAEQIEDARRDPGNHWVPTYTADEAGLQVVHAFGRWFAVWRILDCEPELPEEQHWEVSTLALDRESGLVVCNGV